MRKTLWSSPFRTKMARRTFWLFVPCALLPICLIALLADIHMQRYLKSRISSNLRRSGRLSANGLADLLLLHESIFKQILRDVQPGEMHAVEAGAEDYFDSVELLPDAGQIPAGDGTDSPVLSPEDRQFLESSPVLLKHLQTGTSIGRLVMFGKVGDHILQGTISKASLMRRMTLEVAPKGASLSVLTLDNHLVAASGIPPPLAVLQSLQRHEAGDFDLRYKQDGTRYVGVVSSLSLKARFGGQDWLVVLCEPARETLGPLREFRRSAALLMLVAVGAGCLMGISQIRRHTGHIEQVRHAVRRIANRDFEQKLDIKSGDEVEELCEAFNRMSDSIRNYQDELSEQAASLRESEQRYRQLIELAPDAVLLLQDGLCRFASTAFEKTFGYDEQDLKAGLKFADVCHDTDPESDSWSDIEPAPSPKTHATRLKTKCGAIVPCETSSVTIQHEGRPAILVCVRDVSERQNMEDRLHQTEKMEAIGQLAGGIAHDFNNQLAGIMGYAELLTLSIEDPQYIGFAEKIVQACGRARDLTSQLLAFSRRGKYRSIPVDIHSTIGEVTSLLRHSIDRRVHISQRLVADLPITTGDPTQLQNALLNLAINARDAMPEGGELTFSTETVTLDEAACRDFREQVAPGRYIRVTVADTGVGMDETTQQRLFEPFFTTKGVGAGTGLGLAAVYGTVVNHQGAITFETAPGKGTAFHVWLPACDVALLGDEQPLSGQDQPKGAGQILVVDDDQMVRDMVRDMLTGFGYEVTVCSDGREGVDYYATHHQDIDLVILDLVMPEMSGRDAFEAMKKTNSRVKVLLSSGYSIGAETEALMAAGAWGFLSKPFLRRELAEKVAAAIKNGDQRRTV